MARTYTRKCPQCSTLVQWPTTKTYPFCSNRCQLIDLGLWARGDYRIPSEEPIDEETWLEFSKGEEEEEGFDQEQRGI
ncbi:MAG: DNA gyrase inhibitor YacG [bacterium]|nr:DNA gyrase inhibitor YacG [bacterium]